MSDSIKGLTVKIGADTKDFVKELKKVDKEINATQRTANELQKGLELEFDSKRFVQAQKKAQSALETTEAKAEAIRKQLKFLENSGGIDTAGYKQLETELAKTETRALRLNEQLEKIEQIKLDNANKSIKDLSESLEKAAQKTAVLSAGAAGAIAGITKLGKDAVAVGDEIQTTADQFGLSAEAVQKWNYIAMQSDVPSEQLYQSIAKIRVGLASISRGESNSVTQVLEELFGDLKRIPKNTEEAFSATIIQLSKLEDSTMKAYYANTLFGEDVAVKLIPLLNKGADGLNEISKEFQAVGYLSNDQVKNLANFDNELNKVNKSLEMAKTELGIALIPIVQNFVDILTTAVIPTVQKLANMFNALPDSVKNMITGALLFTAALSPILFMLTGITKIIPMILSGLTALSAHPIIAIIGVVAGLLIYLYTTNEKFAKSINNLMKILGRALNSVMKPIMSLISNIFAVLQPIIELIGNVLVPVLNVITFMLKPIVWLLEKINDLAVKVQKGLLGIFGLGNEETVSSSSSSSASSIPDFNNYNFDVPKSTSNNYANNYSNDNYNVEINMNASGDLNYDSNELANEVIKKIMVAKQSSGRL